MISVHARLTWRTLRTMLRMKNQKLMRTMKNLCWREPLGLRFRSLKLCRLCCCFSLVIRTLLSLPTCFFLRSFNLKTISHVGLYCTDQGLFREWCKTSNCRLMFGMQQNSSLSRQLRARTAVVAAAAVAELLPRQQQLWTVVQTSSHTPLVGMSQVPSTIVWKVSTPDQP